MAHCLSSLFIWCIISLTLLPGTKVSAQDERTGPKATFENVAYGDHPKQILDFWQAEGKGIAPLVIFIHGGGFTGGSHDKVPYPKLQRYLDANIHFASLEYRNLKQAYFPAPHEDVASALQFIRSRADQWRLDKSRIAATGGSAGAQLAAYLAWGDDLANPRSDNPRERESTKLIAVAINGGQSNLDTEWWVDNIPGFRREFHNHYYPKGVSQIEIRAIVSELSIINHIDGGDPPTFMSYGMAPSSQIPNNLKQARGWIIHHVNFGLALEEKLLQSGVEAVLKYPGASPKFSSDVDFLLHHLKK